MTQKILSCRPLNREEAASLLELAPVTMTEGEREQPLMIRFHCSICHQTFSTIWLHPDTPMIYDYGGHLHVFDADDLAKFKKN